MMKKIVFLQLLLLVGSYCLHSQYIITGHWYSEDGSRTYKIVAREKRYEAILLDSKRKDDKTGGLVLSDLKYNPRRKVFTGYIRAVGDGMTVRVKIRIEQDGQTLKLKLQRMLLFPVLIRWRRGA